MNAGNQGWRRLRACEGHDVQAFFAPVGQIEQWVFDLCNSCPVKKPCLDFALSYGCDYGVYGGTTGRQRLVIRKRSNVYQDYDRGLED
jgi:WhiB family redox-sensing transcriptional regulator